MHLPAPEGSQIIWQGTAMDEQDEGIYEVEDVLEHKSVDGKDYFLVKWKGYGDTSWEPDENMGDELSDLKAAAKGGTCGTRKRKHEKEKKDKKEKHGKKDKKEKRREESPVTTRGNEKTVILIHQKTMTRFS